MPSSPNRQVVSTAFVRWLVLASRVLNRLLPERQDAIDISVFLTRAVERILVAPGHMDSEGIKGGSATCRSPKLPDQNSIGKDLNPACYGAVVYRIARVKPKLPISGRSRSGAAPQSTLCRSISTLEVDPSD